MWLMEQLTVMFKEGLYSSVLSFGSVALSLSESPSCTGALSEGQQVTVLIYCGDSAVALGEPVRGEAFYRKALQLQKTLSKSTPAVSSTGMMMFTPPPPLTMMTSSSGGGGGFNGGGYGGGSQEDSNDVKYKVYLCLMAVKKAKDALNMLQSIPAKSRNVRTNLALGKLYMQNGMERAAVTAFKEVLKVTPNCLEAVESLVGLGLKEVDLQPFFGHKMTHKAPYLEWFSNWIKAQQYLHAKDHASAIRVLRSITEGEPALGKNSYLMASLGHALAVNGDYVEATGPLQLCHRLEPANMSGMDLLSFLLWTQRKAPELEKLSARLSELNPNDNRPEPWIALAYYAQLTGRPNKAITFAQKAVSCSGVRTFEGVICKGYLLLEAKKFQEAGDCFREAIQMCATRFEPHDGLVNVYMELQRYRDASTIANFAMKKLGQTPRVLTMCAQPLAKDPLNFTKAKSYLDKALQMNPQYWPAVLTLTEILEEESAYETGVAKLQDLIDSGCGGSVHVHLRMAQLLCKITNSDDKAANHYAIALRLDPSNRDAREGLNRLDLSAGANRSGVGVGGVHESSQVTSYDMNVDHLEDDEDDEDRDIGLF